MVKNTIKVDVKSNNGTKLTTLDFSRINEQCNLVMMQLEIPAGDNWLLGKQGVAQHGLWYRVYNQATVNTMKAVLPRINPRCKRMPNADYIYEVYGPGEYKSIILRCRISTDFKDWPTEQMNRVIRYMNEDLYKNKVAEDSSGTMRDGELKVLGLDTGSDAKRRDKELENKEPGQGNNTWLVEVEDVLWDRLVEVKQGRLKIGSNDGFLEGYDLQEHVKMFLAKEPRPERPNEFRGVIRDQKKAEREAAKKAAQAAATAADHQGESDDDLLNQDD